MFFRILMLFSLLAATVPLAAVRAADIGPDWASTTPPTVPKIAPVSVDVPTTALLLLDFNTPPCNPAKNPRCLATIPAVKALLARARAKGMLVIYTIGNSTSPDSINPELKPLSNESVIPAKPDKFLNSDLAKVLDDHGIKTVITMGTVVNGAVLYTASEAAFRGYKVIVPIDGVSGLTPYAEQFSLWQLMNGPRLGGDAVKLTKTTALSF